MCRHAEHSREHKHGNARVLPTPMYKLHGLYKHTNAHTLYTRTVHAGTQIDWENTSAHIHAGSEEWQWSVSPVIIVLEDERSEAEKGVEECWRGGQRRRKEGEKKRQGRLICTKPGCCLSVERIRHCWSLLLFHRPPPPATYFVFFLYWLVLQFFILVLEEAMDTEYFFPFVYLFLC